MDARVKPGHDEFEYPWPGWSVRKIRATFAPDDPGAAHSLFRGPLGRHDRKNGADPACITALRAPILLKNSHPSRSGTGIGHYRVVARCFPSASQKAHGTHAQSRCRVDLAARQD